MGSAYDWTDYEDDLAREAELGGGLMAGPDELLARTDDWLENTPTVVHAGTVQMVERLAAALRVALAARPQAVFEGTPVELRRWLRGSYASTEVNTTISLAVYRAVAGSAAPTEENTHDL